MTGRNRRRPTGAVFHEGKNHEDTGGPNGRPCEVGIVSAEAAAFPAGESSYAKITKDLLSVFSLVSITTLGKQHWGQVEVGCIVSLQIIVGIC